ncbi:MAG: hypothetical protein ACOZNI_22215 [Myxococcota bacterium]
MSALLFVFALSTDASAHGGGPDHASPASSEAPTTIPATFAEVVAALRTRQTDASMAVSQGRLGDVHALSRAISDLAAAAAAKVAEVSGAEGAAVALQALEIRTAADALHQAADAGDPGAATAAVDRMTRPLLVLSAQGG